jgi:hypothetical protein
LADHDVVLRRRNASALRLSEAEREEERDEAFAALARLLRNLLVQRPAGLEATIDEAFPWATFLPRRDRKLFIDDLTRILVAVSTIDNFAPVGQLLEWKATAEIHADPRLARRRRRRVDVSGEAVQARPAESGSRGRNWSSSEVPACLGGRQRPDCLGAHDGRPAPTRLPTASVKGSLGSRTANDVEMEQWQYEATAGGRIWYCIDDDRRTV